MKTELNRIQVKWAFPLQQSLLPSRQSLVCHRHTNTICVGTNEPCARSSQHSSGFGLTRLGWWSIPVFVYDHSDFRSLDVCFNINRPRSECGWKQFETDHVRDVTRVWETLCSMGCWAVQASYVHVHFLSCIYRRGWPVRYGVPRIFDYSWIQRRRSCIWLDY